ncbi:hypothetical protein IW261DRAFT_1428097 [Armillaria novae-zelandiae]|uniref:Uncharacterized protein n=1 Tax=Armillaria novae-zelandiae TaxID=153914 RepID=A0AA39NBV1_9AGAR|nr:hypothetical protein IW261DRAFT_1428097 [Armillaria novae-zelandiae]
MAPCKKYHSPEDKRQAICDKSKRYYTKHKPEISLRRKAVYQAQAQEGASSTSVVKTVARRKKIANSNHYEIVSAAVKVPSLSPSQAPDPFLKISADARSLIQEFEDFLHGKDPHNYVETLLRLYFKSDSRRQGQLSLFADPLDALYRMRKAYGDIADKASQAVGSCEHLEALIQTGKPIGCLVLWLEDIWRAGSDGPQHLRLAYGRKRLAWQRDSI